MKTGIVAIASLLLAATVVTATGLAEKVSEDDHFVVYRIPVKALPDLHSSASGLLYDGIESFSAPMSTHGRSSSKSASSSKSTSSSTGAGRGKGYGEGSSSHGHGSGTGGSSSGYGHGGGGSSGGYGHGGSGSGHGGSGYGHGGSSGGYGHGGSGYGHGGSGSGHGGSGSGYGGSGSGYGGSGSGHGGSGSGYGGSGSGHGGSGYSSPSGYAGGQGSYTPSYEGGYQPNTQHYEDDEPEGAHYPKITTTTKSFTTNSAANHGGQHYRREAGDSLGDISFKLGDYLKNTPGHEGGRFTHGFNGDFASPGFRSGQGFNVNEFTRSLNQGMTGYKGPSYRNNRIVPQASVIYPMAYGLRNAGFGLAGF
ncbi:hypothetical protein JTE90_009641 [Oedothorax gibbosus]|uniref:Uncharacterized protein n=1 Tax=Oedothorax gibbosus TaxID=931172 RepID=A0AAV6V9W2_9ARAC|nr:hypothetical protein JTE90_009641 [Oedothorax gibbosus]